MPKSGSSWWYNLCNACFVRAGGIDSREFLKKNGLEGRFRGNFSVAPLDFDNIRFLSERESVFIKTHAACGHYAKAFAKNGIIKASINYRDPRDAALSALENGQRLRKRGADDGAFVRLMSVRDAIDFTAQHLPLTSGWFSLPGVFKVRYEALLDNAFASLKAFFSSLTLEADDQAVAETVKRFDKNNSTKGDGLVKLNVGVAGRHKEVFSDRDLQYANSRFAEFLDLAGYAR